MIKSFLFLFLATSPVWAEDSNIQSFKTSSREFTGAVYDELLTDNKDNILVSPFSLETVLALTQSGAKGDTASEIRTTLRLPNTEEETETLMKSVLPTIQSTTYSLQTANKIYVEDDFPLQQSFKTLAADVYNADFQNIDFGDNTAAADEINQWVEEQTNDKIQDLVSSDDFDQYTSVVLINALYFQANWSYPFLSSLTTQAQFFKVDGDTTQVETMHQKSIKGNYYESEELDATFVEIPFHGNASITFVLPNKIGGLGVLEKQINNVLVAPDYSSEYIELFLPKFKMESTIDFVEILQKMGVHKAFDAAQADFSGIGGVKGELSIGSVVQKTFIDVNEVGVEAAAATVADPSRVVPPTATKTVVIDHPFFFYITANEIILFEGRVLLP